MKRRPSLEHISEAQHDPQVRDELQRNLKGHADQSLLAWLRKGSMRAKQYQALGKAILEDDTADMPVKPGSLPGDPVRLRGIPAIGGLGSVGGAIAGSRPGDSLTGKRGAESSAGSGRGREIVTASATGKPRPSATPTNHRPMASTSPSTEKKCRTRFGGSDARSRNRGRSCRRD